MWDLKQVLILMSSKTFQFHTKNWWIFFSGKIFHSSAFNLKPFFVLWNNQLTFTNKLSCQILSTYSLFSVLKNSWLWSFCFLKRKSQLFLKGVSLDQNLCGIEKKSKTSKIYTLIFQILLQTKSKTSFAWKAPLFQKFALILLNLIFTWLYSKFTFLFENESVLLGNTSNDFNFHAKFFELLICFDG